MTNFKKEFINQNLKGFKKYVSHHNMAYALEVVRLNSDGNNFVNEYISHGVSVVVNKDNGNVVIDFIIKEEDNCFVVYEMTNECYNKFELYCTKSYDTTDANLVTSNDDIKNLLTELIIGNEIEVGYRQECGRSKEHNTFKFYKDFKDSLGKISNLGYLITEKSVINKNAYATNNGGFWNSNVYELLRI